MVEEDNEEIFVANNRATTVEDCVKEQDIEMDCAHAKGT